MANSDFLTIIQGLRAQLDTLEAMVVGGKVAKMPSASALPKPKREATEAQKAWTAEIRNALDEMLAAGWKHPETGAEPKWGDAMKEASKRRGGPKPKAVESDSEPEVKPKRAPLTEEQKAKMAEGRKKAAEKRKAEKEAAAAEEDSTLVKKSVKGKKLLVDPETGACYKRIGESEKGEYLGVLKDGVIDTTVAE
jgi:hypothetical protein